MFSVLSVCSAAAQASPTSKAKHADERMDVQDVLSAGEGQYVVVLRTQTKPFRYLPIWVGENEAVAIRMRLDRQDPPRPFTLNLLEDILKAASIRVTEIAIDDYRGGVFLGKIRLRQNKKSWEIDARPSDAIGLAMGRHVPILVTRDIIDGAGLDAKALTEQAPPDEPHKSTPGPAATPTTTSYDESL